MGASPPLGSPAGIAAGASRSRASAMRCARGASRPLFLLLSFILTPCFSTVANRTAAAIVRALFKAFDCHGPDQSYHYRATDFHHGHHVFSADPSPAAAGQEA